MKRVVVTGMGMVSPLAQTLEESWSRLVEGKSAAQSIKRFDASEFPCSIACEVNKGDGTDGTFDGDRWWSARDRRRVDDFITFGMAAAVQAVEQAGWENPSDEEKTRTGVLIGAGIGGLGWIADNTITLHERGHRRVSPHFIAGSIINLVSGNVSIRYDYQGPNHAVVTACATGTHAIGDAARLIMFGDADVMVAGGAEASITPIGMAGFSQARALATKFNDTPTAASRPWDQDRDGFVMGEGAGVVVLESLEHAQARGAEIYAEVVGYGLAGDAHHVTAPAPDGRGGYRAMEAALRNGKLNAGEIDYINAHGTSTPLGDEIEFAAVKRLMGDHAGNIAMSSTKSAIGHLLGAAGAVEALFAIQSIRTGVVPPTLNLDNPSESCVGIDLVAHTAQERKVTTALSNSFGFGGTNASIVMREYNG